jgi:hypothetical protein
VPERIGGPVVASLREVDIARSGADVEGQFHPDHASCDYRTVGVLAKFELAFERDDEGGPVFSVLRGRGEIEKRLKEQKVVFSVHLVDGNTSPTVKDPKHLGEPAPRLEVRHASTRSQAALIGGEPHIDQKPLKLGTSLESAHATSLRTCRG